MGLDMYLSAKKYLGNYDFREEERKIAKEIREAVGFPLEYPESGPEGSVDLFVTVGYWRKANAIHKWFVDQVQEGVDECQESYVGRENLTRLRDLCFSILETRDVDKAEHLLPPVSGFFFGGTEVDQWYWQSLEHTVIVLNDALTLDESWEFYYRSSW